MSDATNCASGHNATGELWQRYKEQADEIERLKRLNATYVADHGEAQDQLQRERDEAREAARFLIANLDHAQEYDVETTAERRWPWLMEVGDE